MKEIIIRQELDNFERDTGIKMEKRRVFSKLFCKYHSDTIWFDKGKLYKVGINSGVDSEGEVEIYEITKDTLVLNGSDTAGEYQTHKYSYLCLIILLLLLMQTSNENYIVYLIPLSIALFILSDKILFFTYKIRSLI